MHCSKKDDLLSSNWDNVTNEENVNVAYSHFIERFQSSYEKCCPVKKVRVDEDNGCIKPWFTKGLCNACRKTNCLYKKFLQNRTDTVEMKYKAYKNKLTSILRNCEKNSYINLLEQEKNNVKGTWKIFNTIIRKGKRSSNYPDSFTHNGATVKNKKDIANGFNDFL